MRKVTSGVLHGRSTAGTGPGEELTPSQARSLLSVYTVSQTDAAISTAVNALVGGAPGLLDTLDELSAALGDDANFANTVTTALAGKVDSSSLNESIDDRVAALLVAGTNITLTYNDASGTLTIASTGSGGNSFATVQPAIGGASGTAVVSDSSSDTLTLDTGCGMTISGNATTDTITLNAFGEEEPIASFMGTIWETVPGIISASTATAITANRKYLIPWKCTKRRTITQVQISVTASATGASMRLGIRNRNAATGEPTTLVSDCGTVSVASNGHKTITGLSITLDPGWYYLEMVSDGAPAVRGVASATAQSTNLGIEAASTSTLTLISGLYRAFTYATLPADETGQAQTNHLTASGNLPIMMVR